MTETLQETFVKAAAIIADFAKRWNEGTASQSELDNADVLLLGLRRLLADYRAGQSSCPH